MPIDKIERLLFAFENKLSGKISCFWLAFATIFSLIYSSTALQEAFSSQYVVQDDARQHVFWMRRFLDAELFPHDLIADYFQSVAPLGYKIIYAIPASLNIDPLIVSKILPGILGIIVTFYSFALTMELLSIPFAGFLATLVLNQNLWLQDGLVSATPKAFAIPILLAFLYYYLKRSLVGTSISILLCGLFYPSLVFISSGLLIIQLVQFENNSLRFKKQHKRDIIFSILGLLVSFLVLLPYAISTSEYAPTITVEQARSLPDFAAGGRSYFFDDENPWDFWLNGSRSGIRIPSALVSPLAYLAIVLPVLFKFPQIFLLTQKVSPKIKVLIRLIIVSVVMFFIAHLLLFQLHLPSRYTQNSLKVVVAIASGISSTIIIHALWQKINRAATSLLQRMVRICFLGCLAVLIVSPYFIKDSIWTKYQHGNAIELYQFLQQQPKDTTIASLTVEADNLPTFTQRSILVSREYAIPYHTGYYFPYRQKVIDLIGAMYSDNLDLIKKFIRQYSVDFFLLERGTFTPEYIVSNSWIKQHQPAD